MISETINEILNEQINKEFYSGYLYLSMSAHLKELGLNMEYASPVNMGESGNSFDGMVFVLTGTLPTLKRAEAQKLIEDRGGKCSSSVSAKTNYVLAGEEAGSKLEKAIKLGIKIISEEEFKELKHCINRATELLRKSYIKSKEL